MHYLIYWGILLIFFFGRHIISFLKRIGHQGRVIVAFVIAVIAIIIFGSIMLVPGDDGEYVWNPFDYVRLTDVDYKAVLVDEPGREAIYDWEFIPVENTNIVVTERLTFDVHAWSKNNLMWELWRALPESDTDGALISYKVNSVKQILDDGTYVVYDEAPRLYWYDQDYVGSSVVDGFGPGKWFHSEGPYDPDMRRYECVLFYVDGLYRETVTFEIEYVMYNAALRYNDMSELYISQYSDETVKYLNSFKAQILIPNEKMPREGNYNAYTYGTNSYEFPFVKSETLNPGYTTFAFELDKSQLQFRPATSYIEFALISYGEDRHIFTEYASYNRYYDTNMLRRTQQAQEDFEALRPRWGTTRIIVFAVCLGVSALVAWYTLSTDSRLRKKYRFFEPAQQIEFFRDIPSGLDPVFAANLAFCRHKKNKIEDGYAAVMLSLARKGYIEMDRIRVDRGWDNDNMKIIVKYRPPIPENIEPLTDTETHYFNMIVRHSGGNEISLNEFQKRVTADYDYTNSFVNNINAAMTNIGVSQGYYQSNNYQKPRQSLKAATNAFWVFGAILTVLFNFVSYYTHLGFAYGAFFILGGVFIASAIYLGRVSKKYLLLTQFGENEYAKWYGLYNFLNSETLMNERTVIELVIWEQYLVYATAFGISEKVAKALEVRCPQTAINTSPVLRNPYYRSRSFYVSSRSFSGAASSASYSARSASYSSGSGGHGGYGGGGRGGGGGGGGH